MEENLTYEPNNNINNESDSSQEVKKKWKPKNIITKQKKIVIIILASLIPITLYYFSYYARNNFCNDLKISKEIFLSTPKSFKLLKTGEIGNTYKININGYEFAIPEAYTPSSITNNSVVLSLSPRFDARIIKIFADTNDKNIKFSTLGIGRWFMPTKPSDYISLILNATWHPVRLMFKAQFYASEGLNSQVYKTIFPNSHIGYIYPTANKDGYKSRVYNENGQGFFELTFKDTVNPPTLRDWADLASLILPITDTNDIPDPKRHTEYNIDELIELANHTSQDSNLIGLCLSEFFRTKSPEWLIPIAIIMKTKEYYIDLNDLDKQYANIFQENSKRKSQWDKIMEDAIKNIVKIEIDPTNKVRELNIFCKNLTQLEIEDIRILVKVINALGKEKSFMVSLVSEGRILPMLEKNIHVKVPDNINLQKAKEINYKIIQIDFRRK